MSTKAGFGGALLSIAVLSVSAAVVPFLPGSWGRRVPFNAGSRVWSTVSDPGSHLFSPWAGLAVFAGYAGIALAAGLAAFLLRDA